MIVSPEALRRAPLFAGMDNDVLSGLVAASHQRQVPRGGALFGQGDRADTLFLILMGWIKLYRLTRDGDEAIINVFAPGETFAEAAVFGKRGVYPVHAEAVEDAVLLAIPRQFFVDRIRQDSDFALHILGAIASHQQYLVQQIEQVTVKSAPQRIGAFLLRLSRRSNGDGREIGLPYDKSLIAGRLNIRPETFSRSLHKLEPHGITIVDRRIRIDDAGKLAEFCDLPD